MSCSTPWNRTRCLLLVGLAGCSDDLSPMVAQITPAEPVTSDDLRVITELSDEAEGEADLSYSWTADGAAVPTQLTDTVRSTFTTRDEVWRVLVTAERDGETVGQASAMAVILDAPPLLDLLVSPWPEAEDGQDLTATVAASDADGDATSVTVSWVADDGTVGPDGETLSAEWTTVGQTWTAQAVDEGGDATPVSRDVAIVDAVPELQEITFDPTSPRAGDTITATATLCNTDDDEASVYWLWAVDGAPVQYGPSATLTGASPLGGQVVHATALVWSGSNVSAFGSASVTIDNTPPTTPEIALDPRAPQVDDAIVCTVSQAAEDVDGDALTYTFAWTIDGLATTATSSTTYPGDTLRAGAAASGQDVACAVHASDGQEDGGDATAQTRVGMQVLLLWDTTGQGTPSLVTAIEAEGYGVTMSTNSEAYYDGTNPSPDAFDVILHLNGTTGFSPWIMPATGQSALVDYAYFGGGFISTAQDPYQVADGSYSDMRDIVLFDNTTDHTSANPTYFIETAYLDHPLVADQPSVFSLDSTCTLNVGALHVFAYDPAFLVALDNMGNAALAGREYGAGRVAALHLVGNAIDGTTCLTDRRVQALLLNAIWWTASVE